MIRSWPARWLAHSGWGITVVLAAATTMLAILTHPQETGLVLPLGIAVTAVAFAAVGTLVALRRPGNPMGWLLQGIGLSAVVTILCPLYAIYTLETRPSSLPGGEVVGWIGLWIWTLAVGQAGTFLLLLFPDGRLPSRRWRVVAWLAAADILACAAAAAIVSWDAHPPSFDPEIHGTAEYVLLGVTGSVFAMLFVVSAAASRGRYRRARGDERQQLKWFGFGVAVAAAAVTVQLVTAAAAGEEAPDQSTSWLVILSIGIPVAIGFAIFKHRLYDVDIVISKTLVYAVLAGFVTAVYLAVVVGVGALAGIRDAGGAPDLLLPLIATALAALGFSGVRDRARRVANRLVYGVRATPYEALSRMSERLSAAYEMEEFLPALTRMLAEATGARHTEVWVRVGGEFRRAAVHAPSQDGPAAVDPAVPVPLDEPGTMPELPHADTAAAIRSRGELLGAITLTKPPNDPLTERDVKLVRDLAAQAAMAIRDVRLTAELRASRQRIVVAQDAERRRLERDIHDGAQQNLIALTLKLQLARHLLDAAPAPDATPAAGTARALALLAELNSDSEAALEVVRDLARGIYPAVLTDKGLIPALRAHLTALPSQSRQAEIEVPENLAGRRYEPEIEAAVYFCVREALQNAAKHAPAAEIRLRLSLDHGRLTFVVADSGPGFDPSSVTGGVGLQNMRDRLEALGGALTVRSVPGTGSTVTGWVGV